MPATESATRIQWYHGISGVVFHTSESTVAKRPLPGDFCAAQLETECRIYERLGQHPYITKCITARSDEIVLERLQCNLRQRLVQLRGNNERPNTQLALRWACQIAQAFHHVHSCGVLQVDIGAYNALLDWEENVKLCDFAGSSLDGSKPTIAPGAHSTHPALSVSQPSIRSELFAIGSMLYEMETTHKPHDGKNDGELEELFIAEQYPDTRDLALGEVVMKCWTRQYADASEVLTDIRGLKSG